MPSLSTLPKGDSAWLLRKSIERIMQQVSVLETNIGSSTTGNSSNGQVIFNDNGTLRGDADMTFNTALNRLIVSSLEVSTTATITGNLTVDTNTFFVDSANNRVGVGTVSPAATFSVLIGSEFLHFGFGANNDNYYTVGSSGAHIWRNSGTEQMRLNSSGNVGIGVTPSAWGSNWKANHVGTVGSFASSGAGSAPPTAMVIGAYNDNTNWKYQFSSTGAARYEMTGANAGSAHAWYISPGGTAGNNITFTQAMTLDASGNLGIGVTSPSYNLDVRAAAATANVQSSTGTNAVSIAVRNTGGSFTLGRENSVGGGSGDFGQDPYASVLWSTGAYPLVFGTNAAHRLQIDSVGNMIPIIQTTAPTLTLNGQMVFNLTSNTNLRISVRGSDGTTRTANITLA